jgi:hypothetical protein
MVAFVDCAKAIATTVQIQRQFGSYVSKIFNGTKQGFTGPTGSKV